MKSENNNPDLRGLHDAFDSLEQRADAAPVSPFTVGSTGRSTRRWGVRVLAPVGAAAVVAAAAVAVAAWPHSSSTATGAQAGGGTSAPISAASVPASEPASSPSSSASAAQDGHYLPPQTGKELAAKTRTILDGIATLKIDPEALVEAPDPVATTTVCTATACTVGPLPVVPALPTPGKSSAGTPADPTPAPPTGTNAAPRHNPDDGSAIYGTLTSAAGNSGGFILNVYATTSPDKASCSGDAGNTCTVTSHPDGTSVAVGRWQDRSVPGGISYEVNAARPDGAIISMILSTESDPKGESTVTSTTLPLSVQQLTAFVTSEQW